MAFGLFRPAGEYKLVVLVRDDLKMGKGKIAAQVGHAAVECALFAEKKDRKAFDAWYRCGQPKIVLKVGSLEELDGYRMIASGNKIHIAVITDAGRTQVDPGTVTCMGLGPAPAAEIDRITGELKMLRSGPFLSSLPYPDPMIRGRRDNPSATL